MTSKGGKTGRLDNRSNKVVKKGLFLVIVNAKHDYRTTYSILLH